MAVNVTVRDIVNFPGGTPKTITLDIAQVVTVAGEPEGDEIWVTSAATTATASGGAAIQSLFKNHMKRGWVKSSGLVSGLVNVPSNYAMKIAIDEDAASGVDITLDSGNNKLMEDIALDIETKLRNQAKIGLGGSKVGDLSYLNAQVRVEGGKMIIESGTSSDRFTGTGRSSVALSAPTGGGLTDCRTLLGFNLPISSEELAQRQIIETSLAATYSSGDVLEVASTAGIFAGDLIEVKSPSTSQRVVVSGAGVAGGLAASQIRFVTQSGASTGLTTTYSGGSLVRKFHPVDIADPVSAITTVDELYRFQIDSIVNQIHFG